MVEKQPLQQIILALLLAWAFIAQLTYSGSLIYQQAHASQYIELPFETEPFSTKINKASPAYPSTALQKGDDLLSLNGTQVNGAEELARIQSSVRPGDTLTVVVARKGQPVTVVVKAHGLGSNWIDLLGLQVVLPLSCLIVGFYIAFARPRDPLAWITLAMLASVGQITGDVSWFIASPWRELLFFYHALLGSTWPLWLLLFGLYFPAPLPAWKKVSWLNWVLAAPWIVFSALTAYGYLMAGAHLLELSWLSAFFVRGSPFIISVFSIYIGGFFALLGRKTGMLESPDAKRRLQLMTAGCILALAPLMLVVFLHLPPWLETVCLLMVLFFPITMAYVIVVQRAMDLRMVVRSGVRYAVAKQGIQLLRVALSIILVLLALRLGRSFAEHWQGLLVIAIGIVLIATVGRACQAPKPLDGSAFLPRSVQRRAHTYRPERIRCEYSRSQDVTADRGPTYFCFAACRAHRCDARTRSAV